MGEGSHALKNTRKLGTASSFPVNTGTLGPTTIRN
jgi:hypothetical protein